MRIAVIGATGRTGRRVVATLCGRGHAVTALGLTASKLADVDARAQRHAVDLTAASGDLAARLADAAVVASCAHARYTGAILRAAPPGARLVLMGSVRRYLAIPDRDGAEIAAGEAALLASGRPGVML